MQITSLYDDIYKNKIKLVTTNIPVQGLKALYSDNLIILDKSVNTEKTKKCILAEELGHYYTSVGNILSSTTNNNKQEIQARDWAVKRLVTLDDLIQALRQGYNTRFDIADYLDVTEEFLDHALDFYRRKFGISTVYKGYKIQFIPTLKLSKV